MRCRALVIALAALCLHCGTSSRQADLKESLRSFDSGDDDTLEARREALEAELAARPAASVIRRAEVRVEGVDLAGDRNPNLELRFPLQHPWRIGADRSLHEAEVQAGVATLHRDALEAQVFECFLTVRHAAHADRERAFADYEEDGAALRAWLDALRSQQLISAQQHARYQLALRTSALRAEPGPTPEPPTRPAVWALTPTAMTALTPAAAEQLLLRHPMWDGYQADEQRMLALSDAQTARRIPWVQWISLNYEPASGNGAARVEALLSFAIPLGIDESARARAYDARADALRWKAKALFDRHLAKLMATRDALAAHEARAAELDNAEAEARAQRTSARSWVDQRSATFEEASSVLEDVHRIRIAVAERREQAGLLRCELLALTGTRPTLQ